jgi:RNA polymerase sigma-70 factor (family 1)
MVKIQCAIRLFPSFSKIRFSKSLNFSLNSFFRIQMSCYNLINDKELVARLKAGSRAAFNRIYKEHSESLYRFAYNILKDEEECTDAIQEVFFWLWCNREKLEIVDLKRYLSAAVKYKLTRVITSSKRKAAILADAPLIKESFFENSLEVKELKFAISQFIETLPPRAKEIFQLSRNEYLSNKEIADRLDISEKTVENQMTISLKKLKFTLGKMSFWSVFL